MNYDDAESLFKCIDVILAQESLLAIKLAEYPHTTRSAQTKLHNTLNKIANPPTIKAEAKVITTADLAAILNQG